MDENWKYIGQKLKIGRILKIGQKLKIQQKLKESTNGDGRRKIY